MLPIEGCWRLSTAKAILTEVGVEVYRDVMFVDSSGELVVRVNNSNVGSEERRSINRTRVWD